MSITCFKNYTLQSEDDMGLIHAIHVPDQGYIYGIRGGIVSKYSATTGAKISSQFVHQPSFDDCYIAYEQTTAKLYVYVSCEQDLLKGVYEVDPFFLVAPVFHSQQDIATTGGQWELPSNRPYAHGGRYPQTYGTHVIWFVDEGYQEAAGHNWLYSWMPLAYADTGKCHTNTFGHFTQLAVVPVDADNCVCWICENVPGVSKEIWNFAYQLSTFTFGAASHYTLPEFNNYGIAYASSNDKIYSCGWHDTLVKMDPGTGAFTSITIGYATRKKMRVQDCPIVGRNFIYIPVTEDGVVLEVEKTTDVVTVKTGFSYPFDIVVTDAKVFAVQLGSPALKEIV